MSLPLPDWLQAIPEDRRAKARRRFLVRVAALYATEAGTVPAFSEKLGLHVNTLREMANRSKPAPVKLCIGIEQSVGRDKLPREMLNPEIFSTQG